MPLDFPEECLRSLPGRFSSWRDGVLQPREPYVCSIEVPLAPCELPATYEVDERRLEGRRISFDFTQVPVTTLRELAGKSLRFPKNPEHGYVDGSLYVEHAHNPVDLTEISFGSVSRDRVEAILRADFISEFERVQEPRGAAADAPHVR